MVEVQYRAYFFGNMYFSQIQQGIQAGHVIAEMFVNHLEGITVGILNAWANKHKTMILLNGGYQSSLQETYNTLVDSGRDVLTLPIGRFHEEKDSVNGALTCVGAILPSYIYDNIGVEYDINSTEYDDAYELYVSTMYGDIKNYELCVSTMYGDIKSYMGYIFSQESKIRKHQMQHALKIHKLIKSFRLA